MAPPDHPEAAILPVGVVERDHHVRQLIAVGADVTPVGGVLVPSEARPLARPFQVDLVGPQSDPVRLENPAKRHDQPGVCDQRLEVRVEMVEGLDHADRLAVRVVLELDGRVRRLHVAVPVDSVVVALGGLIALDRAGLRERRALRTRRHPLRRRPQALEVRRIEDGFAREEAVFFVARAFGVGQLEIGPFQESLRRLEESRARSGVKSRSTDPALLALRRSCRSQKDGAKIAFDSAL